MSKSSIELCNDLIENFEDLIEKEISRYMTAVGYWRGLIASQEKIKAELRRNEGE